MRRASWKRVCRFFLCAGLQWLAERLTDRVRDTPCSMSAHLQIWDQMTKESRRQHNRTIQLLPEMGREHLALV